MFVIVILALIGIGTVGYIHGGQLADEYEQLLEDFKNEK